MRKRCAAMVVLATIILASGHQFSLAQKLLSSLSPRVTYYVSQLPVPTATMGRQEFGPMAQHRQN